jgi:hypothetical protein
MIVSTCGANKLHAIIQEFYDEPKLQQRQVSLHHGNVLSQDEY